MRRLMLRADASGTIGAGHVSRMVAYAERAVARRWEVVFSGRVDNAEWLAARFGELSVPVVPSAPFDDFDVVLVDHYDLGELRQEVNAAGALLVSIEDDVFGRREADLVVDCGFAPAPRPDDGSGALLRGVAYAPLRDVVREAREKRRGREEAERPHVTVVLGGGTEWAGTVSALLHALRDTGLPFVADVLVRGEPTVPAALPGQEFRIAPPGPGLLDLLVEADVAVSAAGVTLLELCCLGVPTGVVQLVDNQETGYRGALDLGLAAGLGSASALDAGAVETLRTLLRDTEARRRLSEKAASVVDGKGVDRVLDRLEALEDRRCPRSSLPFSV
ncbi:spore coat protein [Amycolatopsis umgeniensis]|uniref:Spore coat polysaccharide biosynthesis predicted glycosyltransferase SpsG n=1 Tax=Amycolatopsis umgeniensis TaxID=336628 RepID=A0A841B693_9PSEU|nr:spore coat protein [Amycolatopsis umgeniensis]MBB5854380.1 spore coat polysaccharide biosynthesis predicted glycosyltransferase SpsG [Amycolatopsis umgeniensis]